VTLQHGESMVRAAARAATLNIFRVDDPAARAFILSGPEAHYFASLAASLMDQTAALSSLFAAGPWSAVASSVARLGDLLCYCTDVLDLGIDGVSEALTGALWSGLAIPLLATAAEMSPAPPPMVSRTAALFVLSRLAHSIAHQPLVSKLVESALLDGAVRTAIVSLLSDHAPSCPESVAALMFVASLAVSSVVEEAVLENVGLVGPQQSRLTDTRPASPAPSDGQGAGSERRRAELVACLGAFVAAGAAEKGTPHAPVQAMSHAAWLLCQLAPTASVLSVETEKRGLRATREEQSLAAEHALAAERAACAALASYARGPWADALAPLIRVQHAAMGAAILGPPAMDDEYTASLLLAFSPPLQALADASAPVRAATAPSADALLVAVRRFLVWKAAAARLSGAGSGAPACPVSLALCCSEEPREGFPAVGNLPDGIPCRVAFERGKERRVLLTVATAPLQCDPLTSTALSLLVDAPASALRSSFPDALSADALQREPCGSAMIHAVAPVAGVEVR